MTTRLSILHLEDEPNDAELVRERLTDGDFDCEVVRVETREEFAARLAEGQFDLILSDKTLPAFDGLSALAIARERQPDVPFIFVSGTLGEEVAIESLKNGATDYVLKGRLERLVPVVRRALHEVAERSERKKAEQFLASSEQRFRALIERAPDGIALLSPNGRLLYSSPSTEHILGYSSEEVVGQDPATYTHPDDLPLVLGTLNELFQNPGQTQILQYRFRHKNGTWRWLESVITNLMHDPNIGAVVFNYRDITERKQSEEALAESERHYRQLIETAQEGVWVIGADDRTTFVNTRLAEMLDYRLEEILGKSIYEFMDAEGRAIAEQDLKLRRQGLGQQLDFKFLRKDGTDLWALIEASPILDRNQNYAGALAMLTDITERKRAEEEINRRAKEFAALYQTSTELMAQTDLTTVLQTVVRRAVSLLNAPGGALLLFDSARGDLQVVVSEGAALPVGTRIKMGQGIAGRVAESRQPMIVNDYVHWEHRPPELPDFGMRASIQVPMVYQGELIGVIAVHSLNEEKLFGGSDLNLLLLFASQAGGAVHTARLVTQTEQRANQLASVYDAGLALNRVLEPRAQLEFLFKIAIRGLHGHRAEFFRFEPYRNELRFELGVGHPPQTLLRIQNLLLPADDENDIVGWVSKYRVPLSIPDVQADPRWHGTEADGIGSGVWVAVEHEDNLHGILGILSEQPSAFTRSDERLLVLFANQAAVAMENARHFEAARQRVAELEAINRISTAVRTATGLDEMLPTLLDETLAALNSQLGSIWLYEPRRQGMRLAVQRGGSVPPDQILLRGEGIPGHVLATGEMYLARNIKAEQNALPASPSPALKGGGGACVPLYSGKALSGAIWVEVELPRELEPNEIRLLTALADIIGNAIQQIRLHHQTEQQVQNLSALRRIDAAISGNFDLRLTLNVILEQVTNQLRVDAGSILLMNPYTHTLEFAASQGFHDKRVKGMQIRIGEGHAGSVAFNRRILAIPNLNTNLGAKSRASWIAREGFVTYYGAPLIAKGEVKGVLEIFHRASLEPDEEWLNFFEALAGQAAIAIADAQLFEKMQRANLELTLAYDTTIEGWSRALDLRDKETKGHTRRVTEMTERLARSFGISDSELVHIRRGALLHDIGKMGIPDSILLKPGPLTDAEWEIMRMHPVYAYKLLAPIDFLRPALDIPYCHHEKWDGSGYPRGLRGEQIPFAARLFAAVDIWDALRSTRPYRQAWSDAQVHEHLQAIAGILLDPQVVTRFLELIAGESE